MKKSTLFAVVFGLFAATTALEMSARWGSWRRGYYGDCCNTCNTCCDAYDYGYVTAVRYVYE